jgi:hypothetical protein
MEFGRKSEEKIERKTQGIFYSGIRTFSVFNDNLSDSTKRTVKFENLIVSFI